MHVESEVELAFMSGIRAGLAQYHQDANVYMGIDWDEMWETYKLKRFGQDKLNWKFPHDKSG